MKIERPNLRARTCPSIQYSVKLYTEVIEKLDQTAKESGLRTSNVIRHIFNEWIDMADRIDTRGE